MAQARIPDHPTITAQRIQGACVYNLAFDRIGRIEDLVIEKLSGRVTHVMLCYAGDLHAGGARFPIPWECLRYDVGHKGYVVDEAELAITPQVDHVRFAGGLPWREGAAAHWAAPPYRFGAAARSDAKSRR